jgi:hypothetical protein
MYPEYPNVTVTVVEEQQETDPTPQEATIQDTYQYFASSGMAHPEMYNGEQSRAIYKTIDLCDEKLSIKINMTFENFETWP